MRMVLLILKGCLPYSVFLVAAAAASFFFSSSFCFLGPYSWHMEIRRLGVELQLLVYATATAAPDPSCILDLHHCSQQRWILNALSKARD